MHGQNKETVMQTIIQNGLLIYLWLVLVTTVILFMEINASRKVAHLINKKVHPWTCTTVAMTFLFASFPPIGWGIAWLVRRHRNQAVHTTENLDV